MSRYEKVLRDILSGTSDANIMGKLKYEVIIYWSREDKAFIAEIPELPGCMADGSTYQQAMDNVGVVAQQWLETAQQLGRPIPQPKGRLVFA